MVGLQALDVGGEGLLGEVLSAGVDCDTDGCSKLARNLGGLSTISTYTGGLTFCYSYLELGQAESSSSADFAVVLEAGATDDGPQFVDGARSNARSLLLTGIAARLLLAGLEIFEPMSESMFMTDAGASTLIWRVRWELPGQSARARGVASPCGSLSSVSMLHTMMVIENVWSLRLCAICWLCLIV